VNVYSIQPRRNPRRFCSALFCGIRSSQPHHGIQHSVDNSGTVLSDATVGDPTTYLRLYLAERQVFSFVHPWVDTQLGLGWVTTRSQPGLDRLTINKLTVILVLTSTGPRLT
jgi:hypothetical protein